jgi:hypothetical protein
VNQSKRNQLQSTVSMQNVTSTEEMPPDTTTVTEVLDHVNDENIEKTNTQKGIKELLGILLNVILDTNERNDCITMIYVMI